MEKLTNILDFIALLVQLGGTALMFYNSPENKPEGMFFGDGNPVIPTKKNKRLKIGFLILGIGFLIALAPMVIKMLA